MFLYLKLHLCFKPQMDVRLSFVLTFRTQFFYYFPNINYLNLHLERKSIRQIRLEFNICLLEIQRESGE
jgi:predicted adenine nucleotide alpha hydrolase (AANH) superfamily ATPase